MQPRGFPAEWLAWIKKCVMSHSFSEKVNRCPEGGGLDPTATDGQTGMPLISATVHPHSRCPHYKHDPDLPIQPTKGVPDAKPSSELWK